MFFGKRNVSKVIILKTSGQMETMLTDWGADEQMEWEIDKQSAWCTEEWKNKKKAWETKGHIDRQLVECIERWDRGAWEYTNGTLSQIWTDTIKFENKHIKRDF